MVIIFIIKIFYYKISEEKGKKKTVCAYKQNRPYLEDLEIRGRVETIQTTALLRSV